MGLGSRIRDPGSEIQDPDKTYSGSWIQGSKMHCIPSHALSLALPGIEPGSPASQAGTLPKELSRQLTPMLRIRDFYPRSRILIFSHPGSWIQNSNKREGWKKISCHNFLCSQKFNKIANYFSFELLKKKIWANFQRIIALLNQNCQ